MKFFGRMFTWIMPYLVDVGAGEVFNPVQTCLFATSNGDIHSCHKILNRGLKVLSVFSLIYSLPIGCLDGIW